jgi:hypothetical protein
MVWGTFERNYGWKLIDTMLVCSASSRYPIPSNNPSFTYYASGSIPSHLLHSPPLIYPRCMSWQGRSCKQVPPTSSLRFRSACALVVAQGCCEASGLTGVLRTLGYPSLCWPMIQSKVTYDCLPQKLQPLQMDFASTFPKMNLEVLTKQHRRGWKLGREIQQRVQLCIVFPRAWNRGVGRT